MNLALLILFIVVQLGDAYTTVKVLNLGGKEKNPFVRLLMKKLGVRPALLLIKSTAIAGAIALVHYVSNAYWVLGPLALITGAAVISNTIVFKRLK